MSLCQSSLKIIKSDIKDIDYSTQTQILMDGLEMHSLLDTDHICCQGNFVSEDS